MDNGNGEMPAVTPGETPTPETPETGGTSTAAPGETPEGGKTPTLEELQAEAEALRKQVRALNQENAAKRKAAEAAEAAALAEQGKFKELYEKSEKARQDAEERAAQIEKERLLDSVAAKHHLPPLLRARLQGTTAEEIDADAKELAKLLAPAAPAEPEKPAAPNLNPLNSGGQQPGELTDSRKAELGKRFKL